MMRRVWSVIAAGLGSALLSSCAALNVSSVPLPGSSYPDGYDIVLEFENALNLPDRARVVMDGTKMGVVTKVHLAGDHVEVWARIERGVVVPRNVQAAMQQATILGDIYLALQRVPDATTPLEPGGRVPITQTTSPPALEDTLVHLANFFGSGSIQRAQKTIIGVNRVTPAKEEVRRMVAQVATDLDDLSNNIDTVDLLINSIGDTAHVLAVNTPELNAMLSPDGIRGFKRNTVLSEKLGTLLPSLGTVYSGGFWLLPMFDSLGNAVDAIGRSKRIVEEEYPAYLRFLKDDYLKQDKYPAINITSVVGPDGQEMSGDVEQVLRMLGAVP